MPQIVRALFVTNQLKTGFYDAVAHRMAELGVEISWISLSPRWTAFLLSKGWSRDAILALHDHGAEWSGPYTPTADDIARVARIEAGSGEALKSVLVMDRELNKLRGLDTQAYVYVASREIERFILARDIRYGFGESTWAPEMITAFVLAAHGGGYYQQHPIRVPSSLCAFYEGIRHDRIVMVREPSDADRGRAREAMTGLRQRGDRPYYFTTNMNAHRLRSHWVEEARVALAEPHLNRHDHSVPSVSTRALRRLRARRNARVIVRKHLFEKAPAASERRFALVMLHRQPEASVDVLGAPFNNQLECIKALARIMPFDWEIWVKEHGHAVGDRDESYYTALRNLPGTRVIDPADDSFALIRRAGVVISVAGTASLEAAVLGIPSITFGRMYFAPILLRNGFDPFSVNAVQMAAILAEGDRMRSDPGRDALIETFLASMIAQSFEGRIGDPVTDPSCIEPGNVDRVAMASADMMRIVDKARESMTSERPALATQ
jgi:hypothetical protein